LAINSFAKDLPEEDYGRLRETYFTYFAETETKTHNPAAHSEKSPYIIHYDVVSVIVKKG